MKAIKNMSRQSKVILLNDPSSPQGVMQRVLQPRETIIVKPQVISEQIRNLVSMNLLKVSEY